MKKIFMQAGQGFHLDIGLLLVRVFMGVLMAFYGWEKFIHFDQMANSDFWMKNVNFFGFSGKLPLALTIFAEFFCSIFLIIGLFSRISLFFLAFCMVYIFIVVFPFNIVSKGQNGYEFNTAFTYFMVYAGLIFTGVGKYSLDAKLFGEK